jgi:hypothetical protein
MNAMMSYNILLEYDEAKKQAKAEYAFGQSVSESIKRVMHMHYTCLSI